MNREHLFRAKDIKDKWIYGYLFKYTDTEGKNYYGLLNQDYVVETDCGTVPKFRMVQPNSVCEYTGFKDKNGTKIFEGDVFSDSSSQEVSVVIFEEGCFKVKTYYLDGNAYETRWGDWDTKLLCKSIIDEEEIAGNIFDNPDIIKEPRE